MNTAALLISGVGLVLLGGVASLVFARAPRLADLIHEMLVLPGLLACAGAGGAVLLGGSPIALSVEPRVPGGPWAILVDPLAGWFLVVLGVAGAAATSYGTSYLAQERAHRQVAWVHAVFALLLAAMVMVVVAHAAVLFLLAWEIMALSAYFLIMFDGDREAVRRAGLIYLVLTHTGTLALIAMFLVWGRSTPDLTFDALAAAAPAIPWGGGLVLLLALVGFGMKAGVVPLHFWLPGAHAASLPRVGDPVGGGDQDGHLRAAAGAQLAWDRRRPGSGGSCSGWDWCRACSACSGRWRQHDLKRLLAFQSVENIGIILLGVGAGCWDHLRASAGGRCSASRAPLCTRSITRCSRVCSSWARGRWCTARGRARSIVWAG